MRRDTGNNWKMRLTDEYLQQRVRNCLESLTEGESEPQTKEECMEMLYTRVRAHAEHAYTSYTHTWSESNLPKEYLLEEIRDSAEELFVGCNVTLTVTDISSASSSSSTPPVLDRTYELNISWNQENGNSSTTTSSNQEHGYY